ncbi:ccd4aa1b-a9e3-416f-8100-044259aeedd4 [Sclerotinia trifoliorum]|uniref:Ccd4aa1b-a9e3-416f-8100-044259aeedd4 n=1 Tax=Sclerotinia trifoliorum TaxID=28548 RepID=A0A8H2ZL27_9HELO|nr:ccd4aa1b-a9e3-416f-8100-044259aeedd4 [Sclerotinia trifoliorum]
MSAAQTKADSIIAENAVAVFSKSYCPYCNATKKLLNDLKANYYAIELDQVADGSEIQAYLKEKTDQGSVPNIFIGQKHIGGNSDLQAKNKKELEAQLKELNVIAA